MRKIIIMITVITLILSILSTGLLVLFTSSSPVVDPTMSGETR